MSNEPELRLRTHALAARLCERHSQVRVKDMHITQAYDAARWDGMERHGTVLRNRAARMTFDEALASVPNGWVVAAYRWTHRLEGQQGIGTVAAVDWEALALWAIALDAPAGRDYDIDLLTMENMPLTF